MVGFSRKKLEKKKENVIPLKDEEYINERMLYTRITSEEVWTYYFWKGKFHLKERNPWVY